MGPAPYAGSVPSAEPSPLARALGRIPTGLYVVSAHDGENLSGFVGSFLMQVGIDPPMLCLAVGKTRGPLEVMRRAGRFGISILDSESHGVMGRFFGKPPREGSPFSGLELIPGREGTPVLRDALAWLECRITGEHETGDHVVVFGQVVDGGLAREGDPSIRLRQDGLGY
jgi:flavin reductase (DIM6/NTAB) family NADH-FMN oxidoreductase RutF